MKSLERRKEGWEKAIAGVEVEGDLGLNVEGIF